MNVIFRSAARLLSRRTSDGSFLPVIDGLRFVAIAWVFLFHSAGYVAKRIHAIETPLWSLWDDGLIWSNIVVRFCSVGFFGVQLFFAISGFVLALPFARARLSHGVPARVPTLRNYFIRRVTRLEPPYIANILACALWATLIKGAPVGEITKSALASLAYLHGVLLPGTPTLNGVAWSLEIEVRFYILAPLLALVFLISSTAVRRGLLVAGILVSCAAQSVVPKHLCYGHSIVHQGHYFLLGFLLADFYVRDWVSRRPSRAWDAAGCAGWIMLFTILMMTVNADIRVHGPVIHTATCIAMFLAYAGSLRGVLLPAVLSQPAIYLVGGMCYTIYLWHYPLIGVFGRLIGARLASSSLALDCLAYTAAFAVLSLPLLTILFVTLERPFMDKTWPTKLWTRVRAAIPSLTKSRLSP
jgi:peptidoglycan/LPS O-acetylase OafA/YrhL